MQKRQAPTESLARMVKKGFDDTGKRLEEIEKHFHGLEKRFEFGEKRLEEISLRIQKLGMAFEDVRVEVGEIKYLLRQKASVEEMNEIDSRLTRIEVRLRKAGVL